MVNHVNFISVMREVILSIRLWKDGSFQEDSWCGAQIMRGLVIRLEIMEERNTTGACGEVELEKTCFVGLLFFRMSRCIQKVFFIYS